MAMDKCPKCGSTEISKGKVAGARILFSPLEHRGFFGGGKRFVPFACKNCGYVEFFLE